MEEDELKKLKREFKKINKESDSIVKGAYLKALADSLPHEVTDNMSPDVMKTYDKILEVATGLKMQILLERLRLNLSLQETHINNAWKQENEIANRKWKEDMEIANRKFLKQMQFRNGIVQIIILIIGLSLGALFGYLIG